MYVYCDGAMDYDSKNTGGVGIEIRYPEEMSLASEEISIGRYEGANIERLEIEALIQALEAVIDLFKTKADLLGNVRTIIFKTDRYGLISKTNPYTIRGWRANKWRNHEGKPIKNDDLLDKLDKLRLKLNKETHCRIEIEYGRRKFNKTADKLARRGKSSGLKDTSIAVKGAKIGKRKFDGPEISYGQYSVGDVLDIHVFRKDPVGAEWEIWGELCDEPNHGMKMKIYADDNLARLLQRHHQYRVKVSQRGMHHFRVEVHFEEINLKTEKT